eukprot:TRINITY_DN1291_c0_g1_i1.p1 TRINITY_DN1291_c0_g1~~TRINITY_DN1291_c0_g1_i1.p1  ORF type:complete len:254 (+),score=89.57 TRINITY_DN1291_c0_g1_i1:100-861(+)
MQAEGGKHMRPEERLKAMFPALEDSLIADVVRATGDDLEAGASALLNLTDSVAAEPQAAEPTPTPVAVVPAPEVPVQVAAPVPVMPVLPQVVQPVVEPAPAPAPAPAPTVAVAEPDTVQQCMFIDCAAAPALKPEEDEESSLHTLMRELAAKQEEIATLRMLLREQVENVDVRARLREWLADAQERVAWIQARTGEIAVSASQTVNTCKERMEEWKLVQQALFKLHDYMRAAKAEAEADTPAPADAPAPSPPK